ncbi:sugar phosphate isomerase/epimerase [bacterium]|nr:sugar phosphate isomerase/epimerase [bacterium]
MPRTLQLHLGLSGAFCVGRWEQPQNWIRLTSELGYSCHELNTDVLDPFFSGDRHFQLSQAREAREATEEYNVVVSDVYAGLAPRLFHGISHADPIPRQKMIEWIVTCMDLAREVGTNRIAGHWDTISAEVLESGEYGCKQAVKRLIELLRDLAQIGRDKGLASISQDQGCVPSCVPWTLKQAEEFLIEANRKNSGCPIRLSLNLGQMAGMHHGLHGKDLDYREWLRALGPFAEVIRLQQTTPEACRFWPFTEEYNQQGYLRLDAIIESLVQAHEHFADSWVSEVLEPTDVHWLIVDVRPDPLTPTEVLLDQLRESAEYCKQWLPDGRLELGF